MPTPGANLRPFQTLQLDFAAYIRHPERNPLPAGIEQRRMRIYARLFYNNVESFLSNTFSVFRKLVGEERWHALVRDFLHRHRAQSPYFSHIPEEFLQYLGEHDRQRPTTPPFALELCHYQWVKLALELAPDADCAFDDEPLAIDDAIALSPLAWPLRYAYPVPRIGPDFQPAEPSAEPTYLIACRNRQDRARFLASNAVTTRLLQLVDEGGAMRHCLETVAVELGAPAATIERSGLAILNRLHRHDVVVRNYRQPAVPRAAPSSGCSGETLVCLCRRE